MAISQHKNLKNNAYYPRTTIVLHIVIQGTKFKFEENNDNF